YGYEIPICSGPGRQVLQVHVTTHDRHVPPGYLSELPGPGDPIVRQVFILSNADFKSNHCSLLPALPCVSKLSERQICSKRFPRDCTVPQPRSGGRFFRRYAAETADNKDFAKKISGTQVITYEGHCKGTLR